MKQKLLAITFLFILLGVGCSLIDPMLGKWKRMGEVDAIQKLQSVGTGGNGTPYIEFRYDGTYNQDGFIGKWERLDDNQLKMQPPFAKAPSTVIVKIQNNTLTLTSKDGTSSKWQR